jgi:CPA1 family monovalent cation:H+ antiporter
LITWALLVSAVVIGVRLSWQFVVPYLIRAVDHRASQIARRLSWQQRVVLGWCGMRGAVSLAAALALPLEAEGGIPFPERDLLIFLSFAVILATLVGQGLTLKPLILVLHLGDDGAAEREEWLARVHATDAALARLEELTTEGWVYQDTVARVRAMLEYRRSRFASRIKGEGSEAFETRSAAYQRLLRDLLAAQRQALLTLRNEGHISDEIRRRVERDLDFEESRLED